MKAETGGQFRRRCRLVAAACLALILPPVSYYVFIAEGWVHAARPMTIRPGTPADFVPTVGAESDERVSVRTIAVADGPLERGRRVRAALFLVRDQEATEVADGSTGFGTRDRYPRWNPRRVTVALVDSVSPRGRTTRLAVRGGPQGGGGDSLTPHRVEAKFRQTFAGRLEAGRTYLLHVEGDRRFHADRAMTVEEFARTNRGMFLVVTILRE